MSEFNVQPYHITALRTLLSYRKIEEKYDFSKQIVMLKQLLASTFQDEDSTIRQEWIQNLNAIANSITEV